MDTSTTYDLMLENQQWNYKDFNTLENIGMTSAGREKFSAVFNAQRDETSAEQHSLQRGFSLTHAVQEDKASVSEISDLQLTEELQAQNLQPHLEIPHQAKITSIPLSSLPSKLVLLLSATAKNVSAVRQATETQTVIYIWPVIKTGEASSPFWHSFPESLTPRSPGLKSSCRDVTEDVEYSHITPAKQLAQDEPDRKTRRSYSLIVKSSNSVVSEILKSLANIKNKDYKNMLPLSSISLIEEELEIPHFERNALMIYNGQVYLLYVTRHEDLPAEMEIPGHHTLFMKAILWLITRISVCNGICEDPRALLSREDVVKQNIKCTNCATPTHRAKMSNEIHSSLHEMTTTSQLKACSTFTGKRQQIVPCDDQLLHKTARPSKEGLEKRNKEVKMNSVIVKDARVILKRLCPSKLTKYTGKASALTEKVTPRTNN